MTGLEGATSLQEVRFARQVVEPGNPGDGFLWINPQGGANGNNAERYYWDSEEARWELESAVGPDTPDYPAVGAFWRDTANGSVKQYDGAAWADVGVTDHANLQNVQPADHHTKTTTAAELTDVSADSVADAHFAHATVAGSGDHADLQNVTAAQHHSRPSAGTNLSEDTNGAFNVGSYTTQHTDTVNVASSSSVTYGVPPSNMWGYVAWVSGKTVDMDSNDTNGLRTYHLGDGLELANNAGNSHTFNLRYLQ